MNNQVNFAYRRVISIVSIWISIIAFCPQSAFTQQNKVSLSPAVGSIVSGYLEHLPADYLTNPTKKYPLMVFCHGIGEVGDGSSEALDKIKRNGPPNLIDKGAFPSSFRVNGQDFSFIVISPQFNKTFVPAARLNEFIEWLLTKYRVDLSRIYLTGLSMGGGTTWLYASSSADYAKKLAAIVAVCGANTPTQQKAAVMASQNLPIWALHNDGDPTVNVGNSVNYVKWVNEYIPAPTPKAKLTVFQSTSHNAWSKSYDPAYRENGMNVYEWMLQYTRPASSTVTPPPVVNKNPVAVAGADQQITLPVGTATLNGSASSDEDGTIKTYSWSQTGGGSVSISDRNAATTTVSGFSVAGIYSFELTVTDNAGGTAKDVISITVSPMPVEETPVDTVKPEPPVVVVPPPVVPVDTAVTPPEPPVEDTVIAQPEPPVVDTSVTQPEVPVIDSTVTEPEIPGVPGVTNINPIAVAGHNYITKMPADSILLDGSWSSDPDGKVVSYLWKTIDGSNLRILNPTYARTLVKSLFPGTYTVELTAIDNQGATGKDTVQLIVLNYDQPLPSNPDNSVATANEVVSPYNGKFQYGLNPGYYGNGWTDQTVVELDKKAGANTVRLALPSTFINKYGINIRKNEFDYYTKTLGMRELTLFIEEPSASESSTATHGTCGKAKTFANLYDDIWDNGENGTPINDSNYFAAYVYRLMMNYGEYVRFWEIWNEPDYSYSSGAWKQKGISGSWWDNNPTPCELENLRAPVYEYIRMLRIAYEVIKTYKPDAMICTGGIGYESFLDVIMRNTDNPDNGKVSEKYPLKGGAYFDVLSFHNYPQYQLTKWNNSLGGFVSKRHSDEAAYQFIDLKNSMESLMAKYGYGSTYPAKHVICTETNIPRKKYGDYIGSDVAQRNYTIKSLVKAQANGIKQVYFYATGETADYATASSGFNLMGVYENLKRDTKGNEKLTEQGIAFKTVSTLLRDYEFDATTTAKLKLPSSVDGYAFTNSAGKRKYVIWAITKKDNTEDASATYSFPAEIEGNTITAYKWNYSVKSTEKVVLDGKKLSLDGTPVIVELSTVAVAPNTTPRVVANAGSEINVTLPTSSASLDGSESTADNPIATYAWSQLSGNSVTLSSTNTVGTSITGITKEGIYSFVLTVTDNKGNSDKDTVKIIVAASSVSEEEVVVVKNKISVYPNPILNYTTTLNMVTPEIGNVSLVMYNNHGVSVWTKSLVKEVASMSTVLNFPNLPAGIYYLAVSIENKRLSTIKIVIQ